MKTKTFTKFTPIKHKNKTNMTQSTGIMFMTYLREMINQLVIQYPMKSKKDRYKFESKILLIPHLNLKDHVAFSFIICFF